VVGCHNLAPRRRSERGDRDGERIVRVVLVRPPDAQDTDPRGQGRGHVQDGLVGGEELLGEQVAEPARGLDRPGSLAQRFSPPQQLRDLRARRSDPGRATSASLRSIATAVCVALCGSTPMITDMSTSQDSWMGPRGHSCFRSLVHVPLASHPRRGP
jgi:hypothetical protein